MSRVFAGISIVAQATDAFGVIHTESWNLSAREITHARCDTADNVQRYLAVRVAGSAGVQLYEVSVTRTPRYRAELAAAA